MGYFYDKLSDLNFHAGLQIFNLKFSIQPVKNNLQIYFLSLALYYLSYDMSTVFKRFTKKSALPICFD